MKNFTLILASFLLLFGSCTVQKRTYRPGFTVQWKGDKFQKSNEDVAQEEVIVKEDAAVTVIENATTVATSLSNNKVEPTESTDQPIEASNNSKTQEEEVSVDKQQQAVSSHAEKAPSYLMKKADRFSNGINLDHKASIGADDEGGNGALKAIGWIFIILGIIFLFFVSIIVGILLMLLGLLFFVVGKNN
jgi:hypothetical protein